MKQVILSLKEREFILHGLRTLGSFRIAVKQHTEGISTENSKINIADAMHTWEELAQWIDHDALLRKLL